MTLRCDVLGMIAPNSQARGRFATHHVLTCACLCCGQGILRVPWATKALTLNAKRRQAGVVGHGLSLLVSRVAIDMTTPLLCRMLQVLSRGIPPRSHITAHFQSVGSERKTAADVQRKTIWKFYESKYSRTELVRRVIYISPVLDPTILVKMAPSPNERCLTYLYYVYVLCFHKRKIWCIRRDARVPRNADIFLPRSFVCTCMCSRQ